MLTQRKSQTLPSLQTEPVLKKAGKVVANGKLKISEFIETQNKLARQDNNEPVKVTFSSINNSV